MGDSSSSSKVPVICGASAVLCALVLLFYTEYLTDASIRLHYFFALGFVLVIVPFFASKLTGGDEKKGDLVAIGTLILSVLHCLFMFYMRNQRIKVFLATGAELTTADFETLKSYISPSGVLLLASEGAIKIPASYPQVPSLKDPVGVALQKRCTKKGVSVMDSPVRIKAATFDVIDAVYYSGLTSQLFLVIDQDPLKLTEEEAQKKGFYIYKGAGKDAGADKGKGTGTDGKGAGADGAANKPPANGNAPDSGKK